MRIDTDRNFCELDVDVLSTLALRFANKFVENPTENAANFAGTPYPLRGANQKPLGQPV